MPIYVNQFVFHQVESISRELLIAGIVEAGVATVWAVVIKKIASSIHKLRRLVILSSVLTNTLLRVNEGLLTFLPDSKG